MFTYYWVIRYPFFILDRNYLSDIWCTNIFSQPVACLFMLLMVSFELKKFKILMKFNLSIFLLTLVPLMIYLRNFCLVHCQEMWSLFTSKIFSNYLWWILSSFLCMACSMGLNSPLEEMITMWYDRSVTYHYNGNIIAI